MPDGWAAVLINHAINLSICNCYIIDNEAGVESSVETRIGGGIDVITTTSVSRTAGGWGAGVYSDHSESLIRNSTIAGNFGMNTAGGLSCAWASTSRIVNSIIWSNRLYSSADSTTAANYSCIEGGFPGVGIVSANPRLTADWRLTSLSPCIDAGTLSAAPATDYDGENRWITLPTPTPLPSWTWARMKFEDTESDGLPDHWEIKRFGGILFANAAGDTDHDGLNESGEYQYATDPHNPDTDGDQVPEGWEILYGFNPRLNDSAGRFG